MEAVFLTELHQCLMTMSTSFQDSGICSSVSLTTLRMPTYLSFFCLTDHTHLLTILPTVTGYLQLICLICFLPLANCSMLAWSSAQQHPQLYWQSGAGDNDFISLVGLFLPACLLLYLWTCWFATGALPGSSTVWASPVSQHLLLPSFWFWNLSTVGNAVWPVGVSNRASRPDKLPDWSAFTCHSFLISVPHSIPPCDTFSMLLLCYIIHSRLFCLFSHMIKSASWEWPCYATRWYTARACQRFLLLRNSVRWNWCDKWTESHDEGASVRLVPVLSVCRHWGSADCAQHRVL